jgi:hypothetical protein
MDNIFNDFLVFSFPRFFFAKRGVVSGEGITAQANTPPSSSSRTPYHPKVAGFQSEDSGR